MKDKLHLQAPGRKAVSLCRPAIAGGSTLRLTTDPGKVDCANCVMRMEQADERAPVVKRPRGRQPGYRRRLETPPVTVDDLEAAVWQAFAKLGLKGDPGLAPAQVKHILAVAKEWALSCGAFEQQLGMPAPVWDSLDGLSIRKKRGPKPFVPVPGEIRPDSGGRRECHRCHRWLKMEMFHKDAKRAGGRRTRCKDCIAQTRKSRITGAMAA